MILVTVGTDLPFDRMMRVVDDWVCQNGRQDVFAQIGKGGWEPPHIRFAHFLAPPEFTQYFESAHVIIAHAGMGTILAALHYGKPILVMPKMASLGEHRNEHQTATARRMMALVGVNVAFDAAELRSCLDRLDELAMPRRIGLAASADLLSGLHEFIHQSSTQRNDSQ